MTDVFKVHSFYLSTTLKAVSPAFVWESLNTALAHQEGAHRYDRYLLYFWVFFMQNSEVKK